MKILFIVPIYLKNLNEVKRLQFQGGGGRYPFELAKNLASLKKDDVEMIFFGKKKKSIFFAGMKISVLPAIKISPRFNGAANPLTISLDFFKKIKQADVIHSIQIRTEASLLATIFARFIGKPIFLTDNNFNGLTMARIIRPEYFASAVLAISEEDYDSWNVRNKKIIYGGVDIKKFSYQKKKKNYVLYAGRIASHKGVDVLVNAMPRDYKLIIAGATLEKHFLKYLKKISKGKNIDYVTNPSDTKLIRLYKEAVCFVLPATAKDYMGKIWGRPGLYALVVPEAMSCGTPVIVSNVGALPYFIEDNKNGFVFEDRNVIDLSNKLNKIIKNEKLIEKMGVSGRKLAESKYSWQTIAVNVRKIYYATEQNK